MQYQELKQALKDFIVFTLNDVRKLDSRFYRPRLNEWQAKGYIKKIRRNYYMFSDVALDEQALFMIANRLYAPSYVSFEMALSHYGFIPEGVYSITSASGKKTAQFTTPIAGFLYRKIKSELFFGYRLEKRGQQTYKIAEPEKAVLDYLYLHPEMKEVADFREWRFNGEEFLAKIDMNKLMIYEKTFHNKRLSTRLKKLLKWIHSSNF